jgi:hypothetical protein
MLSVAGSGRGSLEEEEEGGKERPGEEGEEDVGVDGLLPRVPPPPREVEYVRVQRGSATRWADLKGDRAAGGAKYVAPPHPPPAEPPRARPEHHDVRGRGKGPTRLPVPGAATT